MKLATVPVQFDQIICAGGLDQTYPTLSLKSGVARFALNFEASVSGGYTRIAGYERFDGHPSPSDNATGAIVSVATLVNTPVVGDTITESGGASGEVAFLDGLRIGITKISGTFAEGDTLLVGATTIGVIDDIQAGPVSPAEDADFRNACADIYRDDIAAVPGFGAIRGVVLYNDVVYAFRNNAAATALDIYKSTAAGWVQVQLYKTVSFTAGTTQPADGATLTQGGVTALIKRVVRTSGAWTGSAAGQFIIATPTGGNFAAGAATIGSTTVTLAGAQTTLTLSPSGRVECVVANFAGQAATSRVYGCDGVNKAFEFDGDILVPLTTGATTDKPTHVAFHRNFLFLAQGSSVMYSAPGLPYDWSALSGSGEIATGDTITGLIPLPGTTGASALGIFAAERTSILYGTGAATFNLISYTTGTGAIPYTVQNMVETLTFDDRGAISIQAALQYGNFAQNSLTSKVIPFVSERLNKCTCATVSRDKNQYRIFFNDGYGLYITLVNSKLMGCMPVYFPDAVQCAWEGKKTTGEAVTYFGGSDGFVYQMDKGTSFDGEAVDFHLVLNYTSARNSRLLKRWRKAAVEMGVHGSGAQSYTAMQVGYSIGYDSIEYEQPETRDYGKYMANNRFDAFVWDSFFWDGNGVTPVEIELSGAAENLALAFSGSSGTVSPFTINSIIVHYSPRRAMR